MAPTIYVVRHAQGHHNVNNQHHLRDPNVTDLGRTQCTNLSNTFPKSSLPTSFTIMASPLIRTIQTACLGFGDVLKERPDVKFILVPFAQEIANQPCDIGYPQAELKQKIAAWLDHENLGFGIERMDWSLVEDGWNSKAGPYAATLEAVNARAAALRATLYAHPSEAVVLVTHGAFLHFFTADWASFDGSKGTAYENCEFRNFSWEAEEGEGYHLKEVGGAKIKMGRPPGVYAHVLEGIEMVEGQNPRQIKVGNGKI
ncbi:phosphoglycerate mutase-like protein [Aureobasidium sp. EXF-10727]|nr:phosphoglycerate mutase-like protein [Aureobasidium sp. EXF-10727]